MEMVGWAGEVKGLRGGAAVHGLGCCVAVHGGSVLISFFRIGLKKLCVACCFSSFVKGVGK